MVGVTCEGYFAYRVEGALQRENDVLSVDRLENVRLTEESLLSASQHIRLEGVPGIPLLILCLFLFFHFIPFFLLFAHGF